MKIKWLICTVLFLVITILIFLIIVRNSFWGMISTILLFLSIFIGSVLKAYFGKNSKEELEKNNENPCADKEIENGQNLLRYATAILAFLSLLTTAKGMNSFVFDESWMAYLGSFAVQGILVVFSLLLCRFFVQITILNWPSYIKRIVNGLMIMFFCIALLVSSVFSFTYIANNAYNDSWPTDSETIVQDFLMKETDGLKLENQKRGKFILNSINKNANEQIESAFDLAKNKNEKEWSAEISKLVKGFPKKKLNSGKVDLDKAELINAFPQYENQIELLSPRYKPYSNQYNKAVALYNRIIVKIKKYKLTMLADKTEQWISKINSTYTDLENKQETISELFTHNFKEDFQPVRTTFKDTVDVLLTKFSDLKTRIERINELSKKIDKNNSKKSSDELDGLLSKIYMLGVDGSIKVEDLVKTVNELVLDASKDEKYTSKEIEKIIVLKDELNLYKDYTELKQNLLDFTEKKVKKTYFISNKEKDTDKKESDNKKKDADKEDKDSSISYKKWKEVRIEDFKDFSTYVKDLPDMTIYAKQFKTKYNASAVLERASVYERDLIGNLTDIEKAFNYFKYKFPMMAYFSAFIAVFFDLGSFFTGCFLYATEYFKKKSDDKEEC